MTESEYTAIDERSSNGKTIVRTLSIDRFSGRYEVRWSVKGELGLIESGSCAIADNPKF